MGCFWLPYAVFRDLRRPQMTRVERLGTQLAGPGASSCLRAGQRPIPGSRSQAGQRSTNYSRSQPHAWAAASAGSATSTVKRRPSRISLKVNLQARDQGPLASPRIRRHRTCQAPRPLGAPALTQDRAETGKNIERSTGHLAQGIVARLRSVLAHEKVELDPVEAMETVALVSRVGRDADVGGASW